MEKKEAPKVDPKRRYYVAMTVIIISFALIIIMLFMTHLFTFDEDQDQTKFKDNYQYLFNMILPMLAAWVGAVVAFYFGSENLSKAQEAQEKAQEQLQQTIQSKEDKLATKTVKDLLDELPKAREVKTVTLKNKIKEVKKIFESDDLTNVLVIDEQQRPLGVLYKWNFLEKIKDATPRPNDEDDLNEHIDKIETDFVSRHRWEKDKGNKNFATLLLNDSILEAKGKMIGRAGDDDSVLSVRGIIENEEGKVSAIINFSNLTKMLK